MNKTAIRKICITAVFTAIIAALSQITVPTPLGVSLTLQTFAIALTAFLLGAKAGSAATLCYVVLGAAGAPVFSGFAGGLGVVLGPSGGFILAFPVYALTLSYVFYVNKALLKVALCALALILLYTAGITQYVIVSGNSLKVALGAFSLYLIKDFSVVLMAYFLCVRIRRNILRFIQPK